MCVEYAGVVHRCGLVAQKLGWDQGFGWSASESSSVTSVDDCDRCEVCEPRRSLSGGDSGGAGATRLLPHPRGIPGDQGREQNDGVFKGSPWRWAARPGVSPGGDGGAIRRTYGVYDQGGTGDAESDGGAGSRRTDHPWAPVSDNTQTLTFCCLGFTNMSYQLSTVMLCARPRISNRGLLEQTLEGIRRVRRVGQGTGGVPFFPRNRHLFFLLDENTMDGKYRI